MMFSGFRKIVNFHSCSIKSIENASQKKILRYFWSQFSTFLNFPLNICFFATFKYFKRSFAIFRFFREEETQGKGFFVVTVDNEFLKKRFVAHFEQKFVRTFFLGNGFSQLTENEIPRESLILLIANVQKGGNYLPTVTVRWHHIFSVTSYVTDFPWPGWSEKLITYIFDKQNKQARLLYAQLKFCE